MKGDTRMYGYVPLMDAETGEEFKFEILEMLFYEEHVYCVLLNTEIPTDEVVILEVIVDENDEDGVEEYLPVDDEDLLKKLFNMYLENKKK